MICSVVLSSSTSLAMGHLIWIKPVRRRCFPRAWTDSIDRGARLTTAAAERSSSATVGAFAAAASSAAVHPLPATGHRPRGLRGSRRRRCFEDDSAAIAATAGQQANLLDLMKSGHAGGTKELRAVTAAWKRLGAS